MSKIVFITGTDTGVGKTVMTALLLRHLRERGLNAVAMKPFCSGGREDAELLHGLLKDSLKSKSPVSKGEITLDDVNPFYFSMPLAPWVAVQQAGGQQISLKVVLKKIFALEKKCDVLLIEGSGGILVPLGEKFAVLDLIAALKCPALVVGKNKLGTINHTLLTIEGLQHVGIKVPAFVLMRCEKSDFSARTNLDVIGKWVNGGERLGGLEVGFMGKSVGSLRGIARAEKKLKKVLAGIWECL